jgi:hypothetical protein
MIHKNGKVGEIEDVTICVFGSGDIDVSTSPYSVDEGCCLLLTNMKAPLLPIGSDTKENEGKSTNVSGVDVVFQFHKAESVDVVIEALQRIKQRMTA